MLIVKGFILSFISNMLVPINIFFDPECYHLATRIGTDSITCIKQDKTCRITGRHLFLSLLEISNYVVKANSPTTFIRCCVLMQLDTNDVFLRSFCLQVCSFTWLAKVLSICQRRQKISQTKKTISTSGSACWENQVNSSSPYLLTYLLTCKSGQGVNH